MQLVYWNDSGSLLLLGSGGSVLAILMRCGTGGICPPSKYGVSVSKLPGDKCVHQEEKSMELVATPEVRPLKSNSVTDRQTWKKPFFCEL